MKPLTKTMRDALRTADLEKGTIPEMQLYTMLGLHRRGLVHKGGTRVTGGLGFARHLNVRLTDAGMQLAQTLIAAERGDLVAQAKLFGLGPSELFYH
jgi:hypothetical protein